jgi:hypothetical protein
MDTERFCSTIKEAVIMKTGALLGMSGLIAASFLAAPLASFAGGTVTGKVTYAGKAEQKEFLFSKFPNPKFCPKNPNKELMDGDKRFLRTIEVGKDGGLKNAVVSVRDIEDKAFMDGYGGTDVVAEFCDFQPFSGIVVNKKNFRVKGPSSATIFNIGLAEKGSKLEKPITLRQEKAGSFFRLQCDQHEFMQGFFLPVQNKHYVVVNADGTFELKDVPAGKHKILAWHPFAGKMEAEVDVPEGGSVKADFQVKK